jgi:hypothetical protein
MSLNDVGTETSTMKLVRSMAGLYLCDKSVSRYCPLKNKERAGEVSRDGPIDTDKVPGQTLDVNSINLVSGSKMSDVGDDELESSSSKTPNGSVLGR